MSIKVERVTKNSLVLIIKGYEGEFAHKVKYRVEVPCKVLEEIK